MSRIFKAYCIIWTGFHCHHLNAVVLLFPVYVFFILHLTLRISTSATSAHVNFIPVVKCLTLLLFDFRETYGVLLRAEKLGWLSIHDIIGSLLKDLFMSVTSVEPTMVIHFSGGMCCKRFEKLFCSTLLSSNSYLIPLPLLSFHSFLSFVL